MSIQSLQLTAAASRPCKVDARRAAAAGELVVQQYACDGSTSEKYNRNDRVAGFQLAAGADGRFPLLLRRSWHGRTAAAKAIEVDFLPDRAVKFAIGSNPGANLRQGRLDRFCRGSVPPQRSFQANSRGRRRCRAARQGAGNRARGRASCRRGLKAMQGSEAGSGQWLRDWPDVAPAIPRAPPGRAGTRREELTEGHRADKYNLDAWAPRRGSGGGAAQPQTAGQRAAVSYGRRLIESRSSSGKDPLHKPWQRTGRDEPSLSQLPTAGANQRRCAFSARAPAAPGCAHRGAAPARR